MINYKKSLIITIVLLKSFVLLYSQNTSFYEISAKRSGHGRNNTTQQLGFKVKGDTCIFTCIHGIFGYEPNGFQIFYSLDPNRIKAPVVNYEDTVKVFYSTKNDIACLCSEKFKINEGLEPNDKNIMLSSDNLEIPNLYAKYAASLKPYPPLKFNSPHDFMSPSQLFSSPEYEYECNMLAFFNLFDNIYQEIRWLKISETSDENQTHQPIGHGWSGCPLLNNKKLIGILFAYLPAECDTKNILFASSFKDLEFTDDKSKKSKIDKIYESYYYGKQKKADCKNCRKCSNDPSIVKKAFYEVYPEKQNEKKKAGLIASIKRGWKSLKNIINLQIPQINSLKKGLINPLVNYAEFNEVEGKSSFLANLFRTTYRNAIRSLESRKTDDISDNYVKIKKNTLRSKNMPLLFHYLKLFNALYINKLPKNSLKLACNELESYYESYKSYKKYDEKLLKDIDARGLIKVEELIKIAKSEIYFQLIDSCFKKQDTMCVRKYNILASKNLLDLDSRQYQISNNEAAISNFNFAKNKKTTDSLGRTPVTMDTTKVSFSNKENGGNSKPIILDPLMNNQDSGYMLNVDTVHFFIGNEIEKNSIPYPYFESSKYLHTDSLANNSIVAFFRNKIDSIAKSNNFNSMDTIQIKLLGTSDEIPYTGQFIYNKEFGNLDSLTIREIKDSINCRILINYDYIKDSQFCKSPNNLKLAFLRAYQMQIFLQNKLKDIPKLNFLVYASRINGFSKEGRYRKLEGEILIKFKKQKNNL